MSSLVSLSPESLRKLFVLIFCTLTFAVPFVPEVKLTSTLQSSGSVEQPDITAAANADTASAQNPDINRLTFILFNSFMYFGPSPAR